ncbi:MAG: hypothetical protein JSS75_10745 [Bacteroidetes bacterium]|nr:hypothetical protein [Bacteroidota bacterium]
MDQLLNPTHVHLMVTHLSIFGSILGALVLIYGMIAKSHHTTMAAMWLFVVTALSAFIADSTGDAASHTVKSIAGIARATVLEHHQAAEFAIASLYILGGCSLAAIIYIRTKKPARTRAIYWIVLVVALWSFSVTARTGYLGGKIRHTELDAPSSDSTRAPM